MVVVGAVAATAAVLVVVEVALVPLAVVEVIPVHGLDVLAQRRRVGVALGAAGGATRVWFLPRKGTKSMKVGFLFSRFLFAPASFLFFYIHALVKFPLSAAS